MHKNENGSYSVSDPVSGCSVLPRVSGRYKGMPCAVYDYSRKDAEAAAVEQINALVAQYAQLDTVPARERLRRVEAWRNRYGDDPALLKALGRLCATEGLWGKAEEFLVLAGRRAPDRETRLLLAQLYERLGRSEEAHEHYRLAALAGADAAPLPQRETVAPDES